MTTQGPEKRRGTAKQRRAPKPRSPGAPRRRVIPDVPAEVAILPRRMVVDLKAAAPKDRADEAEAYIRLSIAAHEAGELPKAMRAAAKAKEAAPRSPTVRELLGRVLAEMGSHREALAELQTYKRLSGRAHADALIAECLLATGRPEKALELIGALHKTDVPAADWAIAQIVRAQLYAERGDIDAAIGVLRSADSAWPGTKAAPHQLRVRYELARLLEDQGDDEDARLLYARVAVADPTFRDALARAKR